MTDGRSGPTWLTVLGVILSLAAAVLVLTLPGARYLNVTYGAVRDDRGMRAFVRDQQRIALLLIVGSALQLVAVFWQAARG